MSTPFFSFTTVFICLLWIFLIWERVKRGTLLDKGTLVGLILTVIFGIVGSIFPALQWFGLTPDSLIPYSQLITLILVITTMSVAIGAVMWVSLSHKSKPVINGNPAFRNVSIYYAFDEFDGKDYYLINPKYIANKRTKEVYTIPHDFIEKYIRTQQITSRKAYGGDRKLRNELVAQGFSFNPTEATLRNLDIFLSPDGKLSFVQDIDALTMAKLREMQKLGKLSRYQLIFIYPWRHQFTKTSEFPPSKRVLLDHKTRLAHSAPVGDIWLFTDNIIQSEKKDKHFPFEKIGWWCTLRSFPKKGFYFDDIRPTLSELVES